MPPTARAPEVTAYATEAIRRSGILENPYFTSLRDGTMSADCFRRTQEQFYYAVSFFPRPMAGLIGRIPDPKSRLDILHNLVEEHGEFQESAFHDTTFRRFLTLIGSRVADLDVLALWPEVRAFNSVLTAACVMDELEVGVGCMGVIECAFAPISARIGAGVIERGWVKREQMIHYSLHEKIDSRHADEFFAVLEPSWADPRRRYFSEQGLQLGVYAFDRLYRDMLRRATAAG